jgi:hypothetical protein
LKGRRAEGHDDAGKHGAVVRAYVSGDDTGLCPLGERGDGTERDGDEGDRPDPSQTPRVQAHATSFLSSRTGREMALDDTSPPVCHARQVQLNGEAEQRFLDLEVSTQNARGAPCAANAESV